MPPPSSTSDLRPFICRTCGKAFKSKKSRNNHVVLVHENAANFECESCGKTFHSNNGLTQHQRVHTVTVVHKQNIARYLVQSLDSKCTKSSSRLTNLFSSGRKAISMYDMRKAIRDPHESKVSPSRQSYGLYPLLDRKL